MFVLRPKRWLYLTHRWSGIALCLLFACWFFSGVVMMYVPRPVLTEVERLERLPQLVAENCCVAFEPLFPDGVVPALRMHGERPVWAGTDAQGQPRLRYADDGSALPDVSAGYALTVAARFAAASEQALTHQGLIHDDQWTVYRRFHPHRPLHKIAVNDAAGTELYVSSQTGEVVLATRRFERGWNWVGSVLHWLYFTDLRRQGAVWAQLIIWLSVAGCLLALSGLIVGTLRLRPRRRYKNGTMTPYSGLMRWHHYSGALFGVITLTWIFSGLLSMNPWGLFERARVGDDERALLSGPPTPHP
ncbi:hypothetical protein CAL65_02430 [Alkalilimnicola ehrlichii]|uniref:PepSY-associated TM helix domain protein n=3 Tax=Alkalilimnicola ehrlichii TaxID=351052 RepID=A0A3E0X1U4_9GAMM|nr:PepSY domain-containing protein [Alkalilimnicola ehrlichii]RFA38789.1 hypothetical protein CAL65_02430 [Alkalilimnicola ehrlichii]